jgi:16S rRNA C967 or C1407 C5-methylase (RsmB/RsmF family)/NOL1/NOP2/fmu family ribosome biogenesis protein
VLKPIAGFDEDAFIRAHQLPPVTSVRLHPLKHGGSFAHLPSVPWCAQGRYLAERPVFTLDPAFHAGAFYVQEPSSMFLDLMVREIFPERQNLRVLDLCGAPGGKSTLLASLLDDSALLISNEVIRSRASVLQENIVRWGYTNNWVTSNDPKSFGALEGYFDLVVIDAPCSGSGLFRKDSKALNEWSEANVHLCSQRQQRIIADIWPSLKDGGVLIYATCSYSPAEDEEILDWLKVEFGAAGIEVSYPEDWGIVPALTLRKMTGYRFFPDKVPGEGFFIAAVRKQDGVVASRIDRFKTRDDRKLLQQAAHLLADRDFICLGLRDTINAIFPVHEHDFHLLSKKLFLRKAGLPLGLPVSKDWIPSHEVALSVDRSDEIPYVGLSREDALKFLKKDELSIPLQQKGWLLVTYDGCGLGWIKSLGNRFNNYLPKHWRIRMELPDEE